MQFVRIRRFEKTMSHKNLTRHRLKPSLLKALAGEGRFHLYQLLSTRRLFLFLKCLRTTIAYARPRHGAAPVRSLVLLNGANQHRLYRRQSEWLAEELGPRGIWSNVDANTARRKGVRLIFIWRQILALIYMLSTGRRYFLNLYLVHFYRGLIDAVADDLDPVRNFLCYNDQPYDVAALVYFLSNRGDCRTIVVQHGLIISDHFYFPSNAEEFWAWGELSEQTFLSRHPKGRIIVKGRYADDQKLFDTISTWNRGSRVLRILIAPSHVHTEVYELIQAADDALGPESKQCVSLAVKLHPATKLQSLLRFRIARRYHNVHVAIGDMEILASRYDLLITRDSTSIVDFMILNKPILFQKYANSKLQHLLKGCTYIDEILDFIYINKHSNSDHENKFLNRSINVT